MAKKKNLNSNKKFNDGIVFILLTPAVFFALFFILKALSDPFSSWCSQYSTGYCGLDYTVIYAPLLLFIGTLVWLVASIVRTVRIHKENK